MDAQAYRTVLPFSLQKVLKIDFKNILICELHAPGYGLLRIYSSC